MCNVVLEIDSSGAQTARNVYGTNLLMRTVSGQSLYYMYNGHCDVTSLLDITTKSVSATYYYDAFGNIQTQTGTVSNNITYAGYQYDSETGLYYLNARYYDSKIARFLSEDTYTGNAADPLSLNLYTYCVNDPIMYTDPTGHVVMEYGSRGDGVVALQEMLNKLGYSCGSADGVYGNKTEASVIQYQRDYGLTVDGIVGNQTLTTLKTNVNVMNAPLQVQQTAMASAANAEVGGIRDDTILMSNTTFNNTLNTIENTRISTGCTVNTTVVNNKVVVTGLGDPIVNTVKPSNTVVPSTTQGTSISNTLSAGNTISIGSAIIDFTLGAVVAGDNNLSFGIAQAVNGNPSLPNSTVYKVGKVVGDIGSLFIGGGTIAGGAAGEVGGVALDATGVGAVVGVPLNIVSAGAIAYGGTVVVNGAMNLYNDTVSLMSGNDGGGNTGRPQKGQEFRGGSKNQRDNWYGYKNKDFQNWWHRIGKKEYGGGDIQDKDMAKEVYEYWAEIGKPKVK